MIWLQWFREVLSGGSPVMHETVVRIAAGIVLVGMLVGCGAGGDGSGGGTPAVVSTSAKPAVDATTTDSPSTGPTTEAPEPDGSVNPSEAEELPTVPAVAIEEEADFGDGVTARVTKMAAVDAEAAGAGEIGGPAVAVTIELTNGTRASLPLDAVNVLLSYGSQDTPALPVIGDGRAKSLSGSLKPGASRKGVYVFTLAPNDRDAVTLTVSHTSLSPIVAFEGAAPR